MLFCVIETSCFWLIEHFVIFLQFCELSTWNSCQSFTSSLKVWHDSSQVIHHLLNRSHFSLSLPTLYCTSSLTKKIWENAHPQTPSELDSGDFQIFPSALFPFHCFQCQSTLHLWPCVWLEFKASCNIALACGKLARKLMCFSQAS